MDESRFSRLETRVDKVIDDVAEVKADTKIIHSDLGDLRDALKEHVDVVKEHVTGDKKIINIIEPMMQQMPEFHAMIQDYKTEKAIKQKKAEKLKHWSIKGGLLFGLAGAAAAIIKVLDYLK
jgi:hypothetical protein